MCHHLKTARKGTTMQESSKYTDIPGFDEAQRLEANILFLKYQLNQAESELLILKQASPFWAWSSERNISREFCQ